MRGSGVRETLRMGLVLWDGDVWRLCLCGDEPEGPYLAGGLEDTRVLWAGGEERVSLPCWAAGGLLRWRGGGEAEEGGVRLFPGLLPRLGFGDREERRLATGEGDPLRLVTGEGDPLRLATGEGDTLRLDRGEGEPLRLAIGEGDALRFATGEGDTLRLDTGEGDPLRLDTGDGEPLRLDMGEGDPLRFETGEGEPLRFETGEGDPLRLGKGEGDLLRLGGDPDERLFWTERGEGLYRRWIGGVKRRWGGDIDLRQRTEEKNESVNESSQPKTTETYLDYTCVLGEERVTCGGEQEKVNDVCGQQVMENVSFWKKRKSKSKLKCSTVIKNLLVKSSDAPIMIFLGRFRYRFFSSKLADSDTDFFSL